MNLFNFGSTDFLTFFGVLVRTSALFSVMPLVGNKLVPAPVKILLSLAVSVALFPSLVSGGFIHPAQAAVWGKTASGIAGVVTLEVLAGLMLGFTAKLVFDAVAFGANTIGSLMGFASASMYDPHQESQTEVIAQIQTTLAMLLFLALDGHLLMLRAALGSYRVLGMGAAGFNHLVSEKLMVLTSEVLRFGLQLAGPVALSIFSVHIVFGIIAKALPQINILVLSFSITALVGFAVLLLSTTEILEVSAEILGRVSDWILTMTAAMARDG